MGRVRDRYGRRDHSIPPVKLVTDFETKFLLISDAVARLEAGMFGGEIKRPEPVKAAKMVYPRASVGWGLHKQKAGAIVYAAIMSGELSVNVFISSGMNGTGRPLQVPVEALGQLTRIRGSLPDHAIRPSAALLRDGLVTSELFAGLSNSAMYLPQSEFKAWYTKQKRRVRWPSQRTSRRPRIGRPSKQTDELRTSIIARVEEGSWSAAQPVAKLERLLASRGAPKRNTLKRTVNQIYSETGDPRYCIIPRKRSKDT
jgi:hypothetical protein